MAIELPVEQMTVEEKLRALELLWENLRRDETHVPVPQWHKDLLDQREKMIREGRAHFEDWEAAKRRLTEQTGEN